MRKLIGSIFIVFSVSGSSLYGQILMASLDTLTDKSNVFSSNDVYYYTYPKDYGEIQKLVEFARKNQWKIKVRGRGHSANGSSIPGKGEMLLYTDSLNKIKIWNDTMVSVEAGVIMADCKKYLNEQGYDLITCNEGGSGPTLGGYISAGGIGSNGEPGFWNTVEQVFMVNGKAEQLTIKKTDPNFQWLFGSMGQLGVVYKAYLRIKKLEGGSPRNFTDLSGKSDYNFHWFPIMIPAGQLEIYDSLMQSVNHSILETNKSKSEKKEIKFLALGKLELNNYGIKPPLVYKEGEDFDIAGWKILLKKSIPDYKKVITNIRKLIDQFLKRYGLRSYFQVSYYNPSPKTVKALLGKKTYDDFYKIKKEFDQDFIFGQKIFPGN